MAGAHARAAKAVVVQPGGDGADAVIAGGAPARLHAEAARREIDLIIEDDDVRGGDLVEARRFGNGVAAVVVECLRLHQQRTHAGDSAFGDFAAKLFLPGPEAMRARDPLHGHEADIVAVARIFRARIAETDEEQHDPFWCL